MEFGKLADVSRVDFRLPDDDPRTWATLARVRQGRFEAFMGAPAWGAKAWIGSLYPRGAKTNEFLSLYSRRFNCIELNATHYRTPEPETVRKWRDATPPGFRFCPKAPQEISHRRFLRGAERETEDFFGSIAEFGDRLGCAFIQLAPQFALPDLPLLRAWLRTVPKGFDVAVEFRHPSLFADGQLRPEAYDAIADAGASTVITDVAGRRDVLHTSLTSGTLFLRLILNGLHPSDFERGRDWSRRAAEWKELGLRSAYLFAHQPDDVATPEFCDRWVPVLNADLGSDLRSPLAAAQQDEATKPGQLGFFD